MTSLNLTKEEYVLKARVGTDENGKSIYRIVGNMRCADHGPYVRLKNNKDLRDALDSVVEGGALYLNIYVPYDAGSGRNEEEDAA